MVRLDERLIESSNLFARIVKAYVSGDDKIRPRTLVRIGQLSRENRGKLFRRHTCSGEHTRAVDVRVACDDDYGVDIVFATCFKQ